MKKNGLLQHVTSVLFRLRGVTGFPLQVLGVLRREKLRIKSVCFPVDFVVTTKMNEDCILGQSFFEEHQMILNFCDKTISNSLIKADLHENLLETRANS